MSQLKKINLRDTLIAVNSNDFSQALTSNKDFGITLGGSLQYTPFSPKDIFIFKGKSNLRGVTLQGKQEVFGPKYLIHEKDDTTFIQAGDAWKEIVAYNISNCDYDVTSDVAVSEFKNTKIEDMGWMLIDFDVTYQEMIDFLEENTRTTLLCIQKNSPAEFSGMGFFDDAEATEKIFYTYCQHAIKDKLKNDADYNYDYLDEDQKEAVVYFKAKPEK